MERNWKKKLLSMFLVFALCLSMMPASVRKTEVKTMRLRRRGMRRRMVSRCMMPGVRNVTILSMKMVNVLAVALYLQQRIQIPIRCISL